MAGFPIKAATVFKVESAQAAIAAKKVLPRHIIQAINDLLVKHWNGVIADIYYKDLQQLLKDRKQYVKNEPLNKDAIIETYKDWKIVRYVDRLVFYRKKY